MSGYNCIIWDWNGTLLDDVTASLRSVNDMLSKRGMSPIGIERYRECIDVPIRGFYEKVFDLDNENYDELLSEYNDRYLFYLADCNLSKGAREVLSYVADSGIRQIIVSSCEKNQLLSEVKKYGILEYFDAVLGADGFHAVSKVERAKNYLETFGDRENMRFLAVGDLLHDLEMAVNIGAECVLIDSGHEDRTRLNSSGAVIMDSFKKIQSFIKNA